MDLIKISDTKLKIMLTASDMTHYDLHTDHISVADQHVRHVLRRLLADAKAQTGFDCDLGRLYVQMYPCVDGGCELFISKQDPGEEDALHALPAALAPAKERALRAKDKSSPKTCIYSFSKLTHLISVCKRLYSAGFYQKSDAWVDRSHTYYLVLYDLSVPTFYLPDEYGFLGEYGSKENAHTMQAYLGEYATQLCKDSAIQTFMQL
ncbi:MAG: adaptor protein MecA [Clostridia bacterium]|jgi:negative regulator of genetic competence, sporulation and motility|nr:adaptor protein MecA [Clostridia bacterium]